jgi:hypothetical protein
VIGIRSFIYKLQEIRLGKEELTGLSPINLGKRGLLCLSTGFLSVIRKEKRGISGKREAADT